MNPDAPCITEPRKSDQQEGEDAVDDPSTGRVGIYIGETSRSLAERVGEHMYDAEAFSKKSHIVKHWMRSHPDLDVAPQFKIKILKQFKDCLSRQVGEAIAILLSQDSLLNSKNEYIQNCISRVTVEEDQFARKKRLLEEEAEEKLQEEKIIEFKEKKRPTKRKTEEVPAGWRNPKKRKVSEVPEVPDEIPITEDNITILRRRMAQERLSVIKYLDNKYETDLLKDVATFWERMEIEQVQDYESSRRLERLVAARERVQQDLNLRDWVGWWNRMEQEAAATRRLERKIRADQKQMFFANYTQPNLILVGWRGWWQRMEAESRKEQHKQNLGEGWIRSKSLNNTVMKTSFIEKYFGDKKRSIMKDEDILMAEDNGNTVWNNGRQTISTNFLRTPKRKMNFHHTLTSSAEKRPKINIVKHKLFKENPTYKQTHAHIQPANLDMRCSANSKGRADTLSNQCEQFSTGQSQGKSDYLASEVILMVKGQPEVEFSTARGHHSV